MLNRAGYVLVGGQSSRFGSDKALHLIEGRPLALTVADRVRSAAGSVTLVGSPEKYTATGLPVIADSEPGLGPAGGLAAALTQRAARRILVVACDMPEIRVELLALLLETAERRQADVLMPVSPDGRDQPLCAVYAASAADAVERRIAAGDRKLSYVLADLVIERLKPEDYAAVDPGGRSFLNVNRPEDLPL